MKVTTNGFLNFAGKKHFVVFSNFRGQRGVGVYAEKKHVSFASFQKKSPKLVVFRASLALLE